MVLCVEYKMAIIETGLYHKTSSHICAQHQHNSEHDIPLLSTLFYLPFFVFSLINNSMFACSTRHMFWNYMAKLTSDVQVLVCITIHVSYPFAPGSCTFAINWERKLLPMALRPSTTSLPFSGALIPRSTIT